MTLNLTGPLAFTTNGEEADLRLAGAFASGEAVTIGPTASEHTTALATDVTEYANAVPLASIGPQHKDLLAVFTFDNPTWIAADPLSAYYQFTSRIVDVSDGMAYLADPLPQNIQAAWSHNVKIWRPVTGLDLKIALDMTGAPTGAKGIRLACVADSDLDLFAHDNAGTGYGVCIDIAHNCNTRMRAFNCGGPSQAALQSWCATGGSLDIAYDMACGDGFGTSMAGFHYMTIRDLGGRHSNTARGLKVSRQRFNTYYGSGQVNPGSTGLAIAWATQDCTFVGFKTIGSQRPSSQNHGVWTSACYNTNNRLVGCTSKGNAGVDVHCNTTDSLELVGCDVGTLYKHTGSTVKQIGGTITTVTGVGAFTKIAADKVDIPSLQVTGANGARFTDSVNGYPVVLFGPNASYPAYMGVGSNGDLQFWTDNVSFRALRGVPAANKAGAQLRVSFDGTSSSMKQVEVGAADSAGTGFRTLRIAN